MTADAVGGVWQYATDLAHALRPHGVETTLAVLGPKPSDDQFLLLRHPGLDPGSRSSGDEEAGPRIKSGVTDDAIDVVHTDLPLDWLSSGPEPVLHAARAIADLARDLRADIVQLNSPTLAAATRFPAPVVAVAHGCTATWWNAAHGAAPDPAYRWHADLMRAGLLAADATVAPSAAFAADLQRTYSLPSRPRTVHNGRTSQAAAGQGTPASHAFTAGRLWDRVKNTAVLDRAASTLSAPIRAAGSVTGPHGETVTARNLHLLGNLSTAQLASEFAAQPVFVSAASFEPFGLAVLEAAQAGCALVLSDIPTFRELWANAALFVPINDDAAIAVAIEALLADPARRAALGGKAQARAGRYTPEAMAQHMDGIFAYLLSLETAAA